MGDPIDVFLRRWYTLDVQELMVLVNVRSGDVQREYQQMHIAHGDWVRAMFMIRTMPQVIQSTIC